MNSAGDIIFLVAYRFLFTVYSNLAWVTEGSNSSCLCIHFLFFFIPRWRFVLQTEMLGKYDLPFRWSILPNFQNWALLEVTHSQRSALSVCLRDPRGCAKRKALESQLFFCPVQGCVNKQLSALGLTLYIRENISFSRRSKHRRLGRLPQLCARVTLYDNSVYGNWLRPKGVAKVSGMLEGSGF